VEAEDQRGPAPSYVPFLQRGKANPAVLVDVLLRTDPEATQVEQAYGGRGRALERHPVEAEVLVHGASCLGQRGGCLEHPVELQLVALGAPVGVVEVLSPAGVVGADRLDVTVRVRADPDVLPGRRDHQRLDAQHLLAAEPVAVLVVVREPPAGTLPRPAPRARGDGAEPGHASHVSLRGHAHAAPVVEEPAKRAVSRSHPEQTRGPSPLPVRRTTDGSVAPRTTTSGSTPRGATRVRSSSSASPRGARSAASSAVRPPQRHRCRLGVRLRALLPVGLPPLTQPIPTCQAPDRT
jgi:hypothetical protein